MNLEKAIKLLEADLKDQFNNPVFGLNIAKTLGIEALKWIQWRRENYKTPPILPLLGETEELDKV